MYYAAARHRERDAKRARDAQRASHCADFVGRRRAFGAPPADARQHRGVCGSVGRWCIGEIHVSQMLYVGACAVYVCLSILLSSFLLFCMSTQRCVALLAVSVGECVCVPGGVGL
jgi:hypothetical protein